MLEHGYLLGNAMATDTEQPTSSLYTNFHDLMHVQAEISINPRKNNLSRHNISR